jgi:hypothetical protein
MTDEQRQTNSDATNLYRIALTRTNDGAPAESFTVLLLEKCETDTVNDRREIYYRLRALASILEDCAERLR